MPEPRRAAIHGLGIALPERIVTAAEAAEHLGDDVDERWIMKRTGVAQRHVSAPGARLDELAAAAGRRALEDAGLEADQLDLVIVATFTAAELVPPAAPLVAHQLGAVRAGAFDLGAACTGWVSGLATATAMIETGRIDHALVIGAEIMSAITDPEDRGTAALLADGAGATVIGPATGAGHVRDAVLRADGRFGSLVRLGREPGATMTMEGQQTFSLAVDSLIAITAEILERTGLDADAIDLFVYHQANARIVRAVAQRLGLAGDPRVVDCIADTGNTSAASVPIALEHARRAGLLRPGHRVLTAAVGSGYVWGAAVLDWV